MHFCQDELLAILASVPMIGFAIAWIRSKVHHLRHHKDCEKK